MKRLLTLTVAAAALFAGRVSAEDMTDSRYFTADEGSIVIEEIKDGATTPLPLESLKPAAPDRPIGEIIGAIDSIVNLRAR